GPGGVVRMGALPLTRNGKLDRKALAEGEGEGEGEEGRREYEGPRNEVEGVLAGIWERLLGRQGISIHDNFFALGGDSILSIQLVARAHQVGLRFKVRQLFERQTIAELAAVVEVGGVGDKPRRQAVGGAMGLTPIQL